MENFKPQPKQEAVPQTGMEKMREFLAEKLETMSPLFDKLESMFDKAGENFGNLKLSPELASRAKIVLPVFIGALSMMGNVEEASAQQFPQQQQPTMTYQQWQMSQQGGNVYVGNQGVQQGGGQMTPEQQRDLRAAQNLRTAGGVAMMTGAAVQGAGMMVQDPRIQNALMISGAVLNVAGTGMVVGGNVKAGQAGRR